MMAGVMLQQAAQDRLRLDRGADHLHTLRPGAVAEFLAALGTATRDQSAILQLLADYPTRLTPIINRARVPILNLLPKDDGVQPRAMEKGELQ